MTTAGLATVISQSSFNQEEGLIENFRWPMSSTTVAASARLQMAARQHCLVKTKQVKIVACYWWITLMAATVSL